MKTVNKLNWEFFLETTNPLFDGERWEITSNKMPKSLLNSERQYNKYAELKGYENNLDDKKNNELKQFHALPGYSMFRDAVLNFLTEYYDKRNNKFVSDTTGDFSDKYPLNIKCTKKEFMLRSGARTENDKRNMLNLLEKDLGKRVDIYREDEKGEMIKETFPFVLFFPKSKTSPYKKNKIFNGSKQKNNYKSFLKSRLSFYYPFEAFYPSKYKNPQVEIFTLSEITLLFSDLFFRDIEDALKNQLEKEEKRRKKTPGYLKYPHHLPGAIRDVIDLCNTKDINTNTSIFEEYAKRNNFKEYKRGIQKYAEPMNAFVSQLLTKMNTINKNNKIMSFDFQELCIRCYQEALYKPAKSDIYKIRIKRAMEYFYFLIEIIRGITEKFDGFEFRITDYYLEKGNKKLKIKFEDRPYIGQNPFLYKKQAKK